jgi:hypothetical protein
VPVMDQEVQQLVEMGATAAQARAALKRYKDVMQAAERIFDGQFDDVRDDEPAASSVAAGPSGSRQAKRMPVSSTTCTRVGRVDLSLCRLRTRMRTTKTKAILWTTTTVCRVWQLENVL